MASQTPYIGSKISLISKSCIRYEGILYTVDTKESTISLAKVRSFGTEGRPAENPVEARDEVYEYIIFKATDIKELVVCETPKAAASLNSGLAYDPAIVTASGRHVPASSPVSGTPTFHSHLAQSPTSRNGLPSGRPSLTPLGNNGRGGYSRMNNLLGSGQQRGGYRNGPPMNGGYVPRGGPLNGPGSASRGGGFSARRPSGNFSFGMPRPTPKQEQLKFDKDYDFEQANETFKKEINKLDENKLASGDSKVTPNSVVSEEKAEVKEEGNGQPFYDKKSSFFDSISCQGIEASKGQNGRVDWKKERATNAETFGEETVRTMAFLRRGGYYRRGRGMNYGGGRGGAPGRGYEGQRYYPSRA